MSEKLQTLGIVGAFIAIGGLGLLANELIFSNSTEHSQVTAPQKNNYSEIRPDLGKQRTVQQQSVSDTDVQQDDKKADMGTAVESSAVKSEPEAKSSMVPGSALRNEALRRSTNIQGTAPPKVIQPKVLPSTPSSNNGKAEPEEQQGWLSKLVYGDRAKMAQEQLAKQRAKEAEELQKLIAKTENILDTVLSGVHRKDYKKKRDVHRHPKETLLFLGLRPNMSVIEMWPGEGWYTEIIAPVLKQGGGTLYAASWDDQKKSKNIFVALKRFRENFISKPDIYGKIILTALSERRFDIGADNSADLIFSSRNMYSWMRKKMASLTFEAMFKALKPGGILGIVDHRQDAGTFQDPRAMSGYVTEAHVISMAQKAGFVLVEKSEINANSKDRKKYRRGVFSLPPVYKEGKRSKKKYDAIGESDRMTLKFMKPLAR